MSIYWLAMQCCKHAHTSKGSDHWAHSAEENKQFSRYYGQAVLQGTCYEEIVFFETYGSWSDTSAVEVDSGCFVCDHSESQKIPGMV